MDEEPAGLPSFGETTGNLSEDEFSGLLKESIDERGDAPVGLESEDGDGAAAEEFLESIDDVALRQAWQDLRDAEVIPGVSSSPENPLAAVLQSFVAEKLADEQRASLEETGVEAPWDRKDLRRWIPAFPGWFREHFRRFGGADGPREMPPGLEQLPDSCRIAILGDFGAGNDPARAAKGTVESVSAKLTAVIHLGDIYAAGSKRDVKNNFLGVWPDGTFLSRAVPGNHDAYGGGPFLDLVAQPWQGGRTTFALANSDWLLVGLDTAYRDDDWLDQQAAWLAGLLADDSQRRVILFSHHPGWDGDGRPDPDRADPLRGVLQTGRVAYWYWGHEHACRFHPEDAEFGVRGRCAGASAIPARPRVKATDSRSEAWMTEVGTGTGIWEVTGRNPLYNPGEEYRFAPNTLVWLDLDGPRVGERITTVKGLEVPGA